MGLRLPLPLSAVVLATALLGSAHADGDSLTDVLGPREIALGEAMRGDATGASAIGMNPAGLPLNHELVFEGGYGYRQSDQASLLGVSACDSTNAAPGCFFYNYAGNTPETPDGGASMPLSTTTHIGGLALSHAISQHVLVGSTIKYFHYATNIPGQNGDSGFNFDLGTTLRLTEMASLGVAGYNLWGEHSPEMPRAVGGGLALKPLPILTLSFDMRWILNNFATAGTAQMSSGARYGGGAELFLRNANGQTGVPIRAGALRDNSLGETYLSAGLGFSTMSMGIDVGGRKSISGPSETMIIASVRLFGPRLAE